MTLIDTRANAARIKRERSIEHPCHASRIRDVSGVWVHLHCHQCGAHFWQPAGKWLSPKQWDSYGDFCGPPSAKNLAKVRENFLAASPEARGEMIEAHTWALRDIKRDTHDWRPPKQAVANQQRIRDTVDLLEWMIEQRQPVQRGLFA